VVRGERFVGYGHETRDSVVVGTMEAVRDTVREVMTVTIQLGAEGDTLFQSVVRDRERVSSRDNRAAVVTKTEVRVDTVYVERRDSVNIRSPATNGQSGRSALYSILKRIFWIIVALIGLVVVLRVRRV
jgi:hypothetical protein